LTLNCHDFCQELSKFLGGEDLPDNVKNSEKLVSAAVTGMEPVIPMVTGHMAMMTASMFFGPTGTAVAMIAGICVGKILPAKKIVSKTLQGSRSSS
jgi:hypothetical protein